METPYSTRRRVSRSQTLAALDNSANNTNTKNNILFSKKIEDGTKSRMGNKKQDQQQDRSALIDITNDSPIVGLAAGSLETPLSGFAKQRSSVAVKRTPGSGEALLRDQVKTLLQRVEEEAELLKLEKRPVIKIQGFVSSPIVAPTPANTPQVPNLSGPGLDLFSSLPVVQETMNISRVIEDSKEETMEAEKSVTRSLMLDFSSEKSESMESEMVSSTIASDDESASIWSIQANAGSIAQEEDVHDYEVDNDYDYDEEGEEDEGIEEICEGIRKINVEFEFKGKHTTFVYNSDDEIEKVEKVKEDALRLKGIPTPKGKHTRFCSEDNEDEEC